MEIYGQRAKQLFWALSAGFRKLDIDAIQRELTEDEQGLFFSMSRVDQYHAYRVYETAIELWEQSEINQHYIGIGNSEKYFSILKKAALLHDIGRRAGEFSITDKVMAVVFDSFYDKTLSNNKENKIAHIKKTKKPNFLYLYYFHPDVSEKLLKLIQADPLLIYLVKNHHCEEPCTSNIEFDGHKDIVKALLRILQKADALN